MTNNTPNRNQEPEPVRPWFARLFRRPTPVTTPPIPEGEHILRLTQDLTAALSDAARWKGHADSYEQDRERAVEALAGRIRERDDAYGECALLLAWLAALHPATAVIAPGHDPEGTQVLYLVAGGWQMSWHIRPDEAEQFRHVPVVDVTDPRAQWDGHGTLQRRERIHNHVRLLALDAVADGPLTGVTGTADVPCERCKGTATDPEHSGVEHYGDNHPRPVPEPCADCQFPPPGTIAYRSRIGRMLRCLRHAPDWPAPGDFVEPVTSEDLPDGGTCTHPECGIDVLITQEQRSA
ncbi:hypothetical protein PV735_05460 [Streptomyces turgidiscabies]|uniref:Uncharacterized protein n=1 Tax=Streptomyces turgidiscabies (strain Car8) TaxID=698760 RepID=L7FIL2_STRT8|nr:hypothetical protein [Streptomyces turgidiscabies]ELP71019.1 hypothetical protein STRTUCAR8_05555 [Streptomyces turgidiscabies Car8]MDX3492137.1 hypothetical protein [Streptomyces turgidiscabies]